MGSLTEDQLLQMVRDFIEFESETVVTSKALSEIHKPGCIPLQFADEGAPSAPNLKKLVVMKLRMDGYEASLCKTSWLSSFNSPEGENEFIDVMMEKNIGGKATRVVVDMEFRSQFELAKPTRAYQELTDTLPLIFVGTEARLGKIISLMCSAPRKSLKEKSLHIPPWRKATYMKSKWLSQDCKKIRNEIS